MYDTKTRVPDVFLAISQPGLGAKRGIDLEFVNEFLFTSNNSRFFSALLGDN
jgi:hypothetical protein